MQTSGQRLQTILFYCLCTMMVVVSAVSFVSAFSRIDKSFPGFCIFKWPRVGNFGSSDWPGSKAGLRYMDRIITVDGQPVRQGPDVIAMLRDAEPGTLVQYVIESKGKVREVSVPVVLFDMGDFLNVFLITFLGGFVVFCLGCIVYVLKPNVHTSWIFFFYCLALGIYMVTGFMAQSTYRLVHLQYLATPLVPTTLLHVFLIFPDKKKFLQHYPFLEYLIYLPAVILIVLLQIHLFKLSSNIVASWLPGYSTVNTFVRLLFLSSVVGVVILLIHSLFKATSSTARQRARMMIFGLTVAFLPPVVLQLMSALLKFNFQWNLIVFFVIWFPASISYSISRHNLFDADVIIKRTVGYVVVSAIVVGAYAVVSVVFNVFMGKYQLAQSRAFPILFTLGVILIFNPLRDRVQTVVDRVFFRKEYDYGEIIENVGQAMTSLLELPQILKRLVQTFMDDMFIDTSSVMLLTPEGTEYQVLLVDGEGRQDVENVTIKREDPLMQVIEEEKKELTKYDMIEDPKYREVSKSCTSDFESLQASLMVPLVYQDQVIGSLNLGEKKSGKFYNREDIELLRTLANQGAVAIENARLFQENLEKQRMEEELNIARDLQMSMLPAECPTVEGLDIAAYSVSAREVGGDFYDFIDMGDEKAGFVIGDVTGKSVSGALVMSSSRSVFRMLSEENLTVSESMMRANRRLKKDIKTGMFVALLFAVFNSEDRKMTLCSAGQTQPIHLIAKTGEAELVETEGDTFPLGILEDASYEDTQLQVEPGDRVIFYTDGIVEAMNVNEEMFGFERLLEVIQEAKSMDADTLLKEILEKVNEFAGSVDQHDDITVIVLSVAE